MSDFDQLVPEHIRLLGGYIPGKSLRQAHQESRVTCIKLASNEAPFGPSPLAVQAMEKVLGESNFYPDNDASELRQKIAHRNNVEPEQVVVTAGSTSLLDIIARTLLSPGLNAVTSKRSFIVYPIATKAASGTLVEVPMRSDAYDLDGIASAIDPNTRVVFIANPNNPTGTLIPAQQVDEFLRKVPQNVIVVLDEAYYDFAIHFAKSRSVDYTRSLEYVREGRNVVVLRTFSKAHGLAGVRVGYGIGPKQLISYFSKMRTTFSISALAQAAAIAAFEDESHTRRAVENNAEQSQRVVRELSAMGFHPVPTWANFVYCELGEDAGEVAKRLQSEGVIIRPLGPWGAPQAIRVTVGTPEQNTTFLHAFRKVVAREVAR